MAKAHYPLRFIQSCKSYRDTANHEPFDISQWQTDICVMIKHFPGLIVNVFLTRLPLPVSTVN